MSLQRILLCGAAAACAILLPAFVHAEDLSSAASIVATPESTAIVAGSSVTWKVTAYDNSHHGWDVTPYAHVSLPVSAGGSIAGTTFTSQKAGSFEATITAGSFTTKSALTVTHHDPVGLAVSASKLTLTMQDAAAFTGTFSDGYGNTWDATGVMTLASTDAKATLQDAVYRPGAVGDWKVTATAGSFSKSFTITVVAGKPASIRIDPFPGPIELVIGATKQFTAKVYDSNNNLLADQKVTWGLVAKDRGTLSANGLFTATSKGTTAVQATIDDLKVSVPISVIEKAATEENKTKNTNANTNGIVAGDSTTNTPTNEASGNANTNTATDDSTDTTCTSLALWVALLILIGYAVVLSGYYLLIRKENDPAWWVFPLLLTAIGIIVWWKYFCGGTYEWWPWVLGFSGLVITGIFRYLLRRPKTPSEPKQRPMF